MLGPIELYVYIKFRILILPFISKVEANQTYFHTNKIRNKTQSGWMTTLKERERERERERFKNEKKKSIFNSKFFIEFTSLRENLN